MSNEGCASDKWQWLALAHQRHESAATHRRIEAKIISLVIEYHLSTGGSCDTVLDVCCGNGESTRLLATHFIAALGIDRSEKNVRRSSILSEILDPDEIAAGRIKFAVGNESNLSQSTQDISSNGKVDLVAVCGIAHPFDKSAFWRSSAQVLNPGGTAVLLAASTVCHPSTPNRSRVQEILSRLERQCLAPYKVAGMGCDLHETLMFLPWTNWPLWDNNKKPGQKTLECKNASALGPLYWYWTGDTTARQLRTWLATSPIYYDWRVTNPGLRDTSEDLVTRTFRELTECTNGERFEIGCMIQQTHIKNDV